MPTHIQIGDISPRIQYTADGVQTAFTYPFPIFKDGDIQAYEDTTLKVLATDYTVSGAGISTGGTVTFLMAPASGGVVTLDRRLAIQRTTDFQQSGEFRSKVINDELDYQTAVLQQIADDQARSAQLATTETATVDPTLPSPQADTTLMWNPTATGFVNGPTAGQVSAAQASALNAQTSATNAATSEAGAAGSATAAASSAVAASTAAASNMYATNATKAANFAVLASDNGKQFLIDTTLGNVVVTLPLGSTGVDGFRIALGKTSADNNAVIVNSAGTDLINGGTSWQFSTPQGQSVITLDTTPAPDTWFAAGVGVVAPVGVADLYGAAKPYDMAFVAGFDTVMQADILAVQTYGELVVPRTLKVTGEQLYMGVVPTGTAAIFDIEKNGVSLYTIKPQVAALANAGTAGTLFTTALVAGDRLTFKCTQIGSTVPGSGASFTLTGELA